MYFRCAGYVFQKVGKVAATAVGGGLLLLQVRLDQTSETQNTWIRSPLICIPFAWLFIFQIANNSGYIQVDWKTVEKDVNKAKKQLQKGTNQSAPELTTFVEKVRCFSHKILTHVCIFRTFVKAKTVYYDKSLHSTNQ